MQLSNLISFTILSSLVSSTPQSFEKADTRALIYKVDLYEHILHKGNKITVNPSTFCQTLPKEQQNQASSAQWSFSNASDFDIYFFTKEKCEGYSKKWNGNIHINNQPNNFVHDGLNDNIKSYRLKYVGPAE